VDFLHGTSMGATGRRALAQMRMSYVRRGGGENSFRGVSDLVEVVRQVAE
jgi:hypothetical protein